MNKTRGSALKYNLYDLYSVTQRNQINAIILIPFLFTKCRDIPSYTSLQISFINKNL